MLPLHRWYHGEAMARTASSRSEKRARFADVGGRETKGGLVQVTVTLDPGDLEILRQEVKARADAREDARTDWSVSELVRLAIRAWIAKNVSKR